jgi:copper chaperone CopZ
VRANFTRHTVTVEFDDTKTGIDEFVDALAKKGYSVEGAPKWLD